ncbi:hypothetical protein H5T57_00210 [Candidatus Bipolaricaulota bacterium]|nr:hypothetical protein [Candidatus Bipolaricaulota bacterium]
MGRRLLAVFLVSLTFGVYAQQLVIPSLEVVPSLPPNFELRNWKEVARQYTAFVFDLSAQGELLPLAWWDRRGVNFGLDHLALPAYVGDRRYGQDGAQEAINVIAAVRSGTLVGLDMSHWYGLDLVTMQKEFFNRANGQNLVLNQPNTVSGNSFWYEIHPSILFFILCNQYPELAQTKRGPDDLSMMEIMRIVAERWYEATYVLGGKDGLPDFSWQAFDFAKMQPVFRWWREPDAAAGVAWLLYMAYVTFKDPRFLIAAEWALAYLQDLATKDYNPLYELLLPYGALVAARINAELGRNYDVWTFVKWCFGVSDARPGWGMISGEWDGQRVDGLIGSLTDQEGYAFAMNTFVWAEPLVPLVRYDPRFARAIGKWLLNAAVNARLFYAPYHPANHQSSAFWAETSKGVIPYEGLRRWGIIDWDIVSPYATGDAVRNKWAKTDFALYAGSHAGVFGALISPTNVPGILSIDLLATDYFCLPAYPTYLYYNPYAEEKEIEIEVGLEAKDLYDTVSKTFVARDVSGVAKLLIPPDSARVVVFIPAGKEVVHEGGKLLVEGIVVDWRTQ